MKLLSKKVYIPTLNADDGVTAVTDEEKSSIHVLNYYFSRCWNRSQSPLYSCVYTRTRTRAGRAGPAQVRMFTPHFADSHFSGLGSSGHGFPNRARRFGPGVGVYNDPPGWNDPGHFTLGWNAPGHFTLWWNDPGHSTLRARVE